ncbi:hypothetical protein BDM02DRAFT_3114212 [Thelephora ganbajun]|uniref:Uncharacterized protein n=1 Tax=Thelephora ganbajun TaxID=370292 RepID=A0ACB6ZI27_THEGA|nr:hypothetical protein BDM02DRAFT_3114212 [Thelephora ganbajun]
MALSGSGNVYDALFLPARSALWDTKVSKTRSVQYPPKSNTLGDQLPKCQQMGLVGSLTREMTKVSGFEFADYWDDGNRS